MKEIDLTQIKWDEVINAAAKSELGICALVILALSVVVICLFRNAPMKGRLLAFAFLSIGILGLAFTLIYTKTKMEAKRSEVKSISGESIPEVPDNMRTVLPENVPTVVRRLTEMDLSVVSTNSSNKPSEVFSKHTFTLMKTAATQDKFYHVASTSSKVAPVILSDTHNFTVKERGMSKDNKLHEFLFMFDVSKDPVDKEFDLRFAVKFIGAFDRPEQQWAGILVAQPTELATFRLDFSTNRPASSVNFYVKETATETLIPVLNETLRIKKTFADGSNSLSQVEWQIPRPKIDQRYCVEWQW